MSSMCHDVLGEMSRSAVGDTVVGAEHIAMCHVMMHIVHRSSCCVQSSAAPGFTFRWCLTSVWSAASRSSKPGAWCPIATPRPRFERFSGVHHGPLPRRPLLCDRMRGCHEEQAANAASRLSFSASVARVTDTVPLQCGWHESALCAECGRPRGVQEQLRRCKADT